jgi:hypothetical protein
MKGVILPDHIPVNNFVLRVLGMPQFTILTMSGLEEELDNVDLPDRTAASGGHTKPLEFTLGIPLHHLNEMAAMESWYSESQEPVSPTYKKPATLVLQSISTLVLKSYFLVGMFPSKRKTADLDMNNEGELHVVEWTFRADQVLPM